MKQIPMKKAAMLCLLPFAAFGLLLIAKALYARIVMPWMPPCLIRTFTGYLCPSCGMTHSVFAVTRLQLGEALRQNAFIPFALLLAVLYYIELWTRAFDSPKQIIPRSGKFWICVLIAGTVYTVLRNL